MRILHVDDDETQRLVVETLLAGHDLESVEDGAGALAALAGWTTGGLVLCDYFLPDMNGVEILKKAREAGLPEGVRFVLQSGLAAGPETEAALEAGADEVLEKPLTMGDFRTQLDGIIERAS